MAQMNKCCYLVLGWLVIFSVLGLARQGAGTKKPSENQSDLAKTPRARNIRVETALVAVNVTVTDPLNRFVTGLEKQNFRVFEDKVEQKILHFSTEDAPISVGIIFDISGSMGAKLARAREAVGRFLRTANPEDDFSLVLFNDQPQSVINATQNSEEVMTKLLFTEARGRTALFDAIYLAMNQARKAKNSRKALLIISDGGDNGSRYTEREVKEAIREADVQVYAIGIFEPIQGRSRTPEELGGPALLTEVSEWTGGRHFPVEDLNQFADIAEKISLELRNQYVLHYSPENKKADGKYRRIQVKLEVPRGLPPLSVYFRKGYYASLE